MSPALPNLFAALLRRTWLVGGLAVAMCAALAAHAVASLSEAMYLAPEAHARAVSPPALAPATPKAHPDSNAFVVRNMFCSTCAPVIGPGPTDSFVPDATLIATSVGVTSSCTLRTGFVFGTFGEGDHVPGIGTLDRIGFSFCDFSDGTRHGRLTFGLEQSAVAATTATPAEKDPWDGRLKKIDDYTFEVDRSLVRELVSGAAKPGAVRITPIPGEHGQLLGLRFGAVREGTLPASLGIKNGDLISEINGAHIANANTLLDVLAKLDQLSVVEVDGTRAGKPLGITLRLR